MDKQFEQKKSELQGVNFAKPIINIGSHPENDLVLSGSDVLPFHAVLKRQNGHFQYILLEPDASLIKDGALISSSPIIATEFEPVSIGKNAIVVQGAGEESLRIHVSPAGATKASEKYETKEDEDPILLEASNPALDVRVDESAVFNLEVINGGPIVASFYLRVEGVPEEWVLIDPPVVNLNEGQRRYVNIRITPPRDYTSTAGTHTVTVIATSPNYYGRQVRQDLQLTIEPYYQFSLGNLSPRQSRIPWRKKTGTTYLPIQNDSNTTANFNIACFDEENGCSFSFPISKEVTYSKQATLPLEAGEMISLPIEIRPLKPRLVAMRSKQYYFTSNIQIQEQGLTPQVISGMAISRPLFGWWSMMLTFLAILVTLFIVLQPRINSFGVAAGKDVIELGDTTKLTWSVSPFASRVSISEIDQELNNGQTSITVAPDKSTTYELVSGNWLSGLLGMDYMRKETVLVIPPSPEIGVFEVDTVEVDKGKPVKLRWSATDVDELILTVDKVVYPLTEEEFSGEKEFILENDSVITLEAKNSSGSELRSYFVNVVPPKIDVVAFTIWTRDPTANAGTVANAGASKQASLINAPDPNFPAKLVSLVPDSNNESGYRVEFYQSDRELDKGEQVMLEWDINGVETVQIAPFTDVLPSSGVQPFFPQESMNFVLTAQSGELEKLFMLPVKVFDGQPPEAPTIEFFKASPAKLVGGGNVEFAWSISGEWTNIVLSSGEGEIASGLFPQDFYTVPVGLSTTFILTAYNNDLSSAESIEITIDPALIEIGLEITDAYPDGLFQIGGSTLVTIEFSDIPEESPEPTGKVIITDGTASCTIELPAKSCEIEFTTPGVKTLFANYQGDDIYLQADSEGYPAEDSNINIEVQSATVELVPTYTSISTGKEIANIKAVTLSLDQGIKIQVEVQPSLSFPDDDKSKVNLQICDQTTDADNNPVPVEGSCVFIGGDTVEVAEETSGGRTQGYGYAEITVQKFLSSGTKMFIYNYLHEENAFEPATYEETDISIQATEIYFSSPLCDTGSPVFTNCEIGLLQNASGTPEETEFAFDIYKTSDDTPLPSYLTPPLKDEFSFSENSLANWSCKTEKVSGYWQLICTGSFSAFSDTGLDMVLSHKDNDENYTVTPLENNFKVVVLQKTRVEIGTINVAVGQTVRLTGLEGLIEFWNGDVQLNTNTSNQISGNLIIELVDEDEPPIGVASTTNCQLGSDTNNDGIIDNEDGKVHVDSVGSNCDVYFTSAGTYTLTAEYLGDGGIYASSVSSEKEFKVTKEYEVEADWDLDATTTVTVDRTQSVEITLSVDDDSPGSPDYQAFAPDVFEGKQVLINLEGAGDSCVVFSDDANADGNLVNIFVTTNIPTASFSFNCKTTLQNLQFQVSFPEDDEDNFEISTGTSTNFSVAEQATVNLTFSVFDNGTKIFGPGTKDDYNSAYPNSPMPLNAGVAYQFSFDVGTVGDYYKHTYWYEYGLGSIDAIINEFLKDAVVINFPQKLKEAIDWTRSSCGGGSLNVNPEVSFSSITDLDKYSFYHIYWYPFGIDWDYISHGYAYFTMHTEPTDCTLVFNKTVSVGSNLTDFIYTSDYKSNYTDTISIVGPNVAKQNVTLALSGLPAQGNTQPITDPLTITINVTEQTQTDLDPIDYKNNEFNDHFTISTTPTCGSITNETLNSANQAQFDIVSDDYSACSSTDIKVVYTGSNFFNTANITETLNFSKTNISLNYTSSNQELTGVVTSTSDPDSTVSLTLSSSNANVTETPTGTVKIWIEYVDPNGTNSYTLTGGTGTGSQYDISSNDYTCSYSSNTLKYTCTLKDGAVVFDLDLQAVSDEGEYFYIRYNYSGDEVFNDVSSTNLSAAFNIDADPTPAPTPTP